MITQRIRCPEVEDEYELEADDLASYVHGENLAWRRSNRIASVESEARNHIQPAFRPRNKQKG